MIQASPIIVLITLIASVPEIEAQQCIAGKQCPIGIFNSVCPSGNGKCNQATCSLNGLGTSSSSCPSSSCPLTSDPSYTAVCSKILPTCSGARCWGYTTCSAGTCPAWTVGNFCLFETGNSYALCGCTSSSAPFKANCNAAVCPSGSYCPPDSPNAVSCPAGYYCTPGATAPLKCEAGKYCPAGSSAQVMCPVGHKCPPESATPTQCAPPFYCPQPGAANQTICPIGYMCPDMAMSVAKPCPLGTWVSCTGKVRCDPCPTGRYCPSVTSSVLCPPGYLCPMSSSAATLCPAGYFCPLGSSAALQCPLGSYCQTGSSVPKACDPGSVCPAGSSSQPTKRRSLTADSVSAPVAGTDGVWGAMVRAGALTCMLVASAMAVRRVVRVKALAGEAAATEETELMAPAPAADAVSPSQ